MRESVHSASARRDHRLARIRHLSLWITGGAAAASLGLGTAFAHEVPGHAASATGRTATSAPQAAGPAGARPAQSAAAGTGQQAGGATGHGHKLAPPQRQPVNTSAPPVVSSGGS